MIDEPVELVPYDPKWVVYFQQESASLRSALALPTDAIEHIGSTAVPGLAAKPIIDILLGTESYPPPDAQIGGIEVLGYENLGEAGVPGRVYLRKRSHPSYNLHITMQHGEIWKANIILRDYLRNHPNQARRYAVYKQETASKFSHSLLAYSEQKERIMKDLLTKARVWSGT